MQQPTRYYITKSGEESTVRSVRVTQNPVAGKDETETNATIPAEIQTKHDGPEARSGVKGLVQGAIRKRMSLS